jgi:transaldolase
MSNRRLNYRRTDTTMNPVKTLTSLGQAVWLDYIRRGLLDNGGLERLIHEDGISGVTSNPTIFQKAIAGSRDYASAIAAVAHHHALDDEGVYEQLAIADVQRAADLLRPVYKRSKARDGYISLEVSPRLAMDADAGWPHRRRGTGRRGIERQRHAAIFASRL